MNLRIVAEAEDELIEATEYYENIEPGLGLRFKDEVRRVLGWILHNPMMPRERPRHYRRVNLRTFPYYIAYFVLAQNVWILAVAHARRHPDYWLKRRNQIE